MELEFHLKFFKELEFLTEIQFFENQVSKQGYFAKQFQNMGILLELLGERGILPFWLVYDSMSIERGEVFCVCTWSFNLGTYNWHVQTPKLHYVCWAKMAQQHYLPKYISIYYCFRNMQEFTTFWELEFHELEFHKKIPSKFEGYFSKNSSYTANSSFKKVIYC